jgi:integrase
LKVRRAIDEAPYLNPPRKNVCAIIALRGIRCGDVLRLRRLDISGALDTGTLAYEAKGERWQRYSAAPLRPYLQGLLDCKWPPGGRVRSLVCPRSRADRCQDTAGREIRRAFDRVAADLELPAEDLYAHRFRHTYSTHFLRQMKGDPEAIFKLQQQMGWARLDTAANYLRGSRREELDAVEEQLLMRRS